MADKEVADLTSAGTLDGTESFHVVKGGNSRKSLLSAVLTYIQTAIFGTFGLAFAGNEDAAAARADLGLEDTSTDNTVVRFDGTAGQTQSSGVVVDDSNNISGVGTLSMGDALTVTEHATAPSTPASGKAVIYAKADGKIYGKDDAGTETQLSNSTETAGWTLIDTLDCATGTPASVVSSQLNVDEVMIVFKALSHNNASATVRMEVSTNNGSSYNTAQQVLGTGSASTVYYAACFGSGLKQGWVIWETIAAFAAPPQVGNTSGSTGQHAHTYVDAQIDKLRFSPSAGVFDAGQILIYGK